MRVKSGMNLEVYFSCLPAYLQHSMMWEMYLSRLCLTLEVGHTSRGPLRHHQVVFHLSVAGLRAPDVKEHEVVKTVLLCLVRLRVIKNYPLLLMISSTQ